MGRVCSDATETRTLEKTTKSVAGQRHDTAKRLSLQEVSQSPVLQPLSRIIGSQKKPRGRLPGYLLKLCEGVRQ